MRTIIAILLIVIGLGSCTQLPKNEYTEKRAFNAELVQKWEDWTTDSEGRNNPYWGGFHVEHNGKVYSISQSMTAQAYASANPHNGKGWSVTTSIRDLGAKPTYQQAKVVQYYNWLFAFWMVAIILIIGMWGHWLVND